MSSEGGGWNGEAAAGWPAVVLAGVVVGVGVGVGLGAGGGRVALRAGAAGAARRAGRGFGASTVTCGTVTVGAAPVGGVSGVPCWGCGASAGGVCGVVGGVSSAGVCDDATPARQSSTRAELLSRNKRLLWIDITSPPSWTGTTPSVPTTSASRRETRRVQYRRSLAGAANTRSMSGDGRCARLEQRAL
jgi:hypothetical protein